MAFYFLAQAGTIITYEMTFYREQRPPAGRRGREPRWPHFDRLGPDHYYDEERYPERSFDGYRNDRRYDDWYEDSDIYEEEFTHADPGYRFRDQHGRDQYEHWPEDRFYYHRQQLKPRENFLERGWHRLRDQWREVNGRGRSYGRYPEDHHHGPHGREYRSHNANRGWGGPDRFSW